MLIPPHTLLFDWDNTLMDTWPIIHQALTDTFAHFDMEPWSMDEVKRYVARSMREAFPDVFGERAEEAGEVYIAAYRSYQLERLTPLPGTLELLQHLRTRPLKLAVVSNKRSEFLRKEVDHLDWHHFFDTLVGAGDAEHDKPHAAPALLALKNLSVEPSHAVWFVGDSQVDLECAENAGLTRILYGDVIASEHDKEKHYYRGWGYDAYAKDPEAFKALLG